MQCKKESSTADLDLRAFPPLYKDEPRELRLKRMQAYQQTWQDLESDIKVPFPQRVLDPALKPFVPCGLSSELVKPGRTDNQYSGVGPWGRKGGPGGREWQ